MTQMFDQAILETLQKETTKAVAASTMPKLPVKYLGRSFVVPDDQKWLEIVFIPNNRTGAYWNDEKDYRGLYRLILHWKNDDAGVYPPMAVLNSICSHFSKGTLLSGVQISDNPDASGVIENGSENLFPATIRYQSFRR